jgi:hypothetical protein
VVLVLLLVRARRRGKSLSETLLIVLDGIRNMALFGEGEGAGE